MNQVPYKLIIVEDSEMIVKRLKKLLEPLVNVRIEATASDGYNAVRLVRDLRPDYVILDISLKFGHGIRVLEEISTMERKPFVIVLSNLSYQYYRDKCLDLGAKHFFDKAMEFEKVYDILNERSTNIGSSAVC